MEVAQRVKMEFTQITLDRATIARLRLAAEGKPLAQYIRELSLGLPAPLECKLNSIEAKVVDMGYLFSQLSWQNKKGEIVSVDTQQVPTDERMSLFDIGMIQKAIEEDPTVTRVGWYDLIDGKWVFNIKDYEKEFGPQCPKITKEGGQ